MSGALAGIRVIDFGQYIVGPQVAMMLSDQGADVIRVDPPGGPRWDNPANAVLQRGKRSIVLDLKQPDDRAVARRLIESADVVVENFRPGVMDRLGLGPADLTASNPRLVYCSIPGFASDDPRAGTAAWEGVLGAATSLYSWRFPDDETAFTATAFASSFGAMVAANSVVAALIARERCGLGQRIEAPLFNAMFEAIGADGFRRQQGSPPPRFRAGAGGQYECADGRLLMVFQNTPRHTVWLCERVLPREWAADGLTDPKRLRGEPDLAAELQRRLAELCKTKPAAYWDRRFNEAGVPATICQSTEEWLRYNEQAKASGAVIALDDPEYGETVQAGFPVLLSKTPPRAQGPRRGLNADRDAILAELPRESNPGEGSASGGKESITRALEGIRCLDLTQILAGPTGGRVLAEYGADVIKINNPHPELIHYLHLNSGKRSLLLDLKSPASREILWRLVKDSRVFMQNFALGVAERLGIGEADIRAVRPDVVYSSVSAYSHDGPRGGYRGWEPVGDASTGILRRHGGDGKPLMPRYAVCDYGTGMLSAFAILLGIFHQTRTGEGQHVQTSLTHAGTYHQIPYMIAYEGRVWDEPRGSQRKGWGPLNQLYKASDRWFYLAAPHTGGLQRLSAIESLRGIDAVPAGALEESLAQRFALQPAAVWVERLNAAGLGAHVLMEVEEIMEDAWVKEHRLSVEHDHPGIGMLRTPGPGPVLSRTPVQPNFPAPPPGWHSKEILQELGYGDRFEELVRQGAVAERLPENVVDTQSSQRGRGGAQVRQ